MNTNIEKELQDAKARAVLIVWLFVIGVVVFNLSFVSLYVLFTRGSNDVKINMSYKAGYYDAVGDYYSVLPYELKKQVDACRKEFNKRVKQHS